MMKDSAASFKRIVHVDFVIIVASFFLYVMAASLPAVLIKNIFFQDILLTSDCLPPLAQMSHYLLRMSNFLWMIFFIKPALNNTSYRNLNYKWLAVGAFTFIIDLLLLYKLQLPGCHI